MLNKAYFLMTQIINNKINILSKLNFYLISLLPIGLLAGSLVSNIIVILISFIFIIDQVFKKESFMIKNFNFYFLLIIYFYLLLNSLLVSNNFDSIIRSIGFIRFILLSFAISYYFNFFSEKILKIWIYTFFIVSIDIIFEFIFGHNMIGFSSDYPGRIASFTGDELKIGGYYFGFISLSILFIKNKNIKFTFLLAIIFLIIALLIGERSNFIKIFIVFILYLIFFLKIPKLKKMMVVSLITILPIILILNSHSFKTRYYNHVFGSYSEGLKENKKLDLNFIISNNEHLILYNTAIGIFLEKPIFGSGIKNFRNESQLIKRKYPEKNYSPSNHPHQFHFEILSELGLIGYFLILSNLFYIIFKNKKFYNDFLKQNSFLFIVATLVPILPSGSFFTSFGATIFWINYSFLINSKITK